MGYKVHRVNIFKITEIPSKFLKLFQKTGMPNNYKEFPAINVQYLYFITLFAQRLLPSATSVCQLFNST